MARATAQRSAFPLTLAASTWGAVLDAARKRASDAHGVGDDDEPQLTNAEALQLVRAWTLAHTRAAFPLWYQFAAVAYGWDPESDALDTSTKQAAAMYADPGELWAQLAQLATDGDNTEVDQTYPSLYFDDVWTDPTFAGDVRKALRDDGADAQFKIPLPACKDPKTGKPVGKPRKDPKTGKWRCDPVVVDDPITHAGKHVLAIAAAIGLLWLVMSDDKPRRRRRT